MSGISCLAWFPSSLSILISLSYTTLPQFFSCSFYCKTALSLQSLPLLKGSFLPFYPPYQIFPDLLHDRLWHLQLWSGHSDSELVHLSALTEFYFFVLFLLRGSSWGSGWAWSGSPAASPHHLHDGSIQDIQTIFYMKGSFVAPRTPDVLQAASQQLSLSGGNRIFGTFYAMLSLCYSSFRILFGAMCALFPFQLSGPKIRVLKQTNKQKGPFHIKVRIIGLMLIFQKMIINEIFLVQLYNMSNPS